LLEIEELTVRCGRRPILRKVSFDVRGGEVLALVGSSGAGKSTLLKCLNRLVDLSPGLTVEGQVRLGGEPLYRRRLDVDRLRSRVGMLFQQPVIFPGSVYHNTIFGLRHTGALPRRRWRGRAEEVLAEVGLWREVQDRLGDSAATLSVGQQQRLCLARALALDPEVILMDEPTSALDPAATRAVESLAVRLASRRTVVLVTHDLTQARRVADRTGVVLPRQSPAATGEPAAGELVELAATEELFTAPRDPGVAAYLASAFAPPAVGATPASPSARTPAAQERDTPLHGNPMTTLTPTEIPR
jgi:phosphate transport system ATP-binding protein